MSQRVETSARELVSTRSSQPENGHLRKNRITFIRYTQNHKIGKTNNLTVFGSMETMETKICQGYLCLREDNLSFNYNYIIKNIDQSYKVNSYLYTI
jgi:hypothetical protein